MNNEQKVQVCDPRYSSGQAQYKFIVATLPDQKNQFIYLLSNKN